MRTRPITPPTSPAGGQSPKPSPLAKAPVEMLLAEAALHKISGSGASPGGLGPSPACTGDADVPELSDTSEDERKEEHAALSFRAPLPADRPPNDPCASGEPSTGPSTPTGNWLESRDLERERWVDVSADFGVPGAWGDIADVGSPKPSRLGGGRGDMPRLPPSPSSFHLAGIPMPQGLADLGRSEASSAAPRPSPAAEGGKEMARQKRWGTGPPLTPPCGCSPPAASARRPCGRCWCRAAPVQGFWSLNSSWRGFPGGGCRWPPPQQGEPGAWGVPCRFWTATWRLLPRLTMSLLIRVQRCAS